MPRENKEFFTLPKTMVILFLLILTAVLAHINFFLKDMRPLLDHDVYYLHTRPFAVFACLYDFLMLFLLKFPQAFSVNGFFVYKMLNLIYLIPLIVFTYLTAASLYSRGIGLLAAFFVITYPDVLNAFHKSEVNFMLICCFSMCLYFYLKSNFLEKLHYAVLFFLALFVFAWHHYSFVLYFNISLPVVFLISFYRRQIMHKLSMKFAATILFIVLCMEFSMIFVFFFAPSGLVCSLFPALSCFVIYKISELNKVNRILLVAMTLCFLAGEFYLLSGYLPYIKYSISVVKMQIFSVAGTETARYGSLMDFLAVYLKRICFFYRPSFFVFDFSFFNYLICVSFYIVYLVKQFRYKTKLSYLSQAEMSCLLMILFGLFVMSFGVGAHIKFFTSFFVVMAVLNAGFFYRCYFLYEKKILQKNFIF